MAINRLGVGLNSGGVGIWSPAKLDLSYLYIANSQYVEKTGNNVTKINPYIGTGYFSNTGSPQWVSNGGVTCAASFGLVHSAPTGIFNLHKQNDHTNCIILKMNNTTDGSKYILDTGFFSGNNTGYQIKSNAASYYMYIKNGSAAVISYSLTSKNNTNIQSLVSKAHYVDSGNQSFTPQIDGVDLSSSSYTGTPSNNDVTRCQIGGDATYNAGSGFTFYAIWGAASILTNTEIAQVNQWIIDHLAD